MSTEQPKVLIDESAIQQRVNELAHEISHDYADVDELCLVGVLKGAFVFLADLARRLTVPRRIEFVALSSYGEEGPTGEVRLLLDLRHRSAGQHVLVVDDISDTGHTISYLMRTLRARDPASLRSCVLLRKPDLLETDFEPDYLGFDIPDVWVVGYGLDDREQYRTVPYIGVSPLAPPAPTGEEPPRA
jgi:hypoxanthine phosphoribosyltransferase